MPADFAEYAERGWKRDIGKDKMAFLGKGLRLLGLATDCTDFHGFFGVPADYAEYAENGWHAEVQRTQRKEQPNPQPIARRLRGLRRGNKQQ
ncbi:MAG: hypothetical protein QM738_00355 [Ferruginibacter sp.]